jgi:hypothetical protein
LVVAEEPSVAGRRESLEEREVVDYQPLEPLDLGCAVVNQERRPGTSATRIDSNLASRQEPNNEESGGRDAMLT